MPAKGKVNGALYGSDEWRALMKQLVLDMKQYMKNGNEVLWLTGMETIVQAHHHAKHALAQNPELAVLEKEGFVAAGGRIVDHIELDHYYIKVAGTGHIDPHVGVIKAYFDCTEHGTTAWSCPPKAFPDLYHSHLI